MQKIYIILSILLLSILFSCNEEEKPEIEKTLNQLRSALIGDNDLLSDDLKPIDRSILISFISPVFPEKINQSVTLLNNLGEPLPINVTLIDSDKTISIEPNNQLSLYRDYTLNIGVLDGPENTQYPGDTINFKTQKGLLEIIDATVEGQTLLTTSTIQDISVNPEFRIQFSEPVVIDFHSSFTLIANNRAVPMEFTYDQPEMTVIAKPASDLPFYVKCNLLIDDEITSEEYEFDSFAKAFYTELDSTLKFPEISDNELLTKVQEQTFKYFWDFGHPESGLSRERNTSGETVTIGGSGFGVMSILVGIERGFITRDQGVVRLNTITTFLEEKAERFHGVWSHWLNGTTGKVIPFSNDDDGADLVETAFMIQALFTIRQYLDDSNAIEKEIIDRINRLIEEVEWTWLQQDGQNKLYWHWSPNFGWQKNLAIRGWNESLIIYVLAASSETYPITKEVYDNGWARNGGMVNGNTFYGFEQPLGRDRGGPLFFAHYSFLGLDPRNLSDQYADYWMQNRNHTLINRAYCIENPQGYVGYNEVSWGLTASDGNSGYSAHAPNNDRGVITPTAAISSIPYTPEESMDAIRHFYYILGDKLWGPYGFYDAFNPTANWYASSYIAIDQGPIICMIENYRTGLLWDLFMSAPEVQDGLQKLGFEY